MDKDLVDGVNFDEQGFDASIPDKDFDGWQRLKWTKILSHDASMVERILPDYVNETDMNLAGGASILDNHLADPYLGFCGPEFQEFHHIVTWILNQKRD